MDENKLIPTKNDIDSFDYEISGVKIERRKRRTKRKRRGKAVFVLLLFTCVALVVFQNFDAISNFLHSLIASPETTVPSDETNEQDSVIDSFINDKSNPQDITKPDADFKSEYAFIDTSPSQFTSVYEFKSDFDTATLSYSMQKKEELYERYGETAPIVLLVNFSPLECYSNGVGYSQSSEFYSENNNVSNIGETICHELNEVGINAIHLKCAEKDSLYETQKQYQKEIESILTSNPSISYIFDVSRALNINRDMSMNKENVITDDNIVPTIGFLCGTNNGTFTDIQKQGVFLSKELSKHFNSFIPLLVSRETVSRYELNQNFPVVCIRVDIGSYANTFEEVTKSAKLFSKLLAEYLGS